MLTLISLECLKCQTVGLKSVYNPVVRDNKRFYRLSLTTSVAQQQYKQKMQGA